MNAQRRQTRRGRPPAGPPALLTKLYGEGNVESLRAALLRLSGLSREAAALPAALVQPHDHADYSQVGGCRASVRPAFDAHVSVNIGGWRPAAVAAIND